MRIIAKTEARVISKKSTKPEALHDAFKKNRISPESITMNDDLMQEIKQYADTVSDYLHPSYTKHLLGILSWSSFLQ